jgi:hypothetical protein
MGFTNKEGIAMGLLVKWATQIFVTTNNWKTIIGYLLIQIPWFSENPLLATAVRDFLSDPTSPELIAQLIVNLLLAWGVIHRVFKNVKGVRDVQGV